MIETIFMASEGTGVLLRKDAVLGISKYFSGTQDDPEYWGVEVILAAGSIKLECADYDKILSDLGWAV